MTYWIDHLAQLYGERLVSSMVLWSALVPLIIIALIAGAIGSWVRGRIERMRQDAIAANIDADKKRQLRLDNAELREAVRILTAQVKASKRAEKSHMEAAHILSTEQLAPLVRSLPE